MNLKFDKDIASSYFSNSQIARILTEKWVKHHVYCPCCGNGNVDEFANNRPVADFYCSACNEEFELKAKSGNRIGKKVVDGAYSTMIERIDSDNNPNFFFLTYSKAAGEVTNFVMIPKHFFSHNMIEKRKPLAKTARRAGWVGCNIDLTKIPKNGHIFLVKNSQVISRQKVISKWNETAFLKQKKGGSRGWILDIMNCVDRIDQDIFSLSDVYAFVAELEQKYPNNHFIKDKIRQQLQILRDYGLLHFKQPGVYQKVKS